VRALAPQVARAGDEARVPDVHVGVDNHSGYLVAGASPPRPDENTSSILFIAVRRCCVIGARAASSSRATMASASSRARASWRPPGRGGGRGGTCAGGSAAGSATHAATECRTARRSCRGTARRRGAHGFVSRAEVATRRGPADWWSRGARPASTPCFRPCVHGVGRTSPVSAWPPLAWRPRPQPSQTCSRVISTTTTPLRRRG
jgi:hypothetical protein